jgi:hypothetical protein
VSCVALEFLLEIYCTFLRNKEERMKHDRKIVCFYAHKTSAVTIKLFFLISFSIQKMSSGDNGGNDDGHDDSRDFNGDEEGGSWQKVVDTAATPKKGKKTKVDQSSGFSTQERAQAFAVIEQEMERRGSSSLAGLLEWMQTKHKALYDKIVKHDYSLAAYLTQKYYLQPVDGKVMVLVPQPGYKDDGAKKPVSQQKEANKKNISEDEALVAVARILRVSKVARSTNDVKSLLGAEDLLARLPCSFQDLLKIGVARGEFVLGPGDVVQVAKFAPKSHVATAAAPSGSAKMWHCSACRAENSVQSKSCRRCGGKGFSGGAFPEVSGVVVVSDVASCRTACEALASCPHLAIDCEGVNLGRAGGSLSLIQIAGAKGVFLFDVKDRHESLMEAGLRDLLQSPNILKAIHDCKMDVCALRTHCDVRVAAVFDTQLAFSILNKNSTNKSLAHVIKETTGKTHPHKANSPHKIDPLFWAIRPLVRNKRKIFGFFFFFFFFFFFDFVLVF